MNKVTRKMAEVSFRVKITDDHVRDIMSIAVRKSIWGFFEQDDQQYLPKGMNIADALADDYPIVIRWLVNANHKNTIAEFRKYTIFRKDVVDAIERFITNPGPCNNILTYENNCMRIDISKVAPNIADKIIEYAILHHKGITI